MMRRYLLLALSSRRSHELQSILFNAGRREEAAAEAERSRDLPAERSFQEAYALGRALAERDSALVEVRLAAYLETDVPVPAIGISWRCATIP